jgi:hypothetical protein
VNLNNNPAAELLSLSEEVGGWRVRRRDHCAFSHIVSPAAGFFHTIFNILLLGLQNHIDATVGEDALGRAAE